MKRPELEEQIVSALLAELTTKAAVEASLRELRQVRDGVSGQTTHSAFARCFSLESVALPDSVDEINDSAFEDCAWLTSIDIPGSVTIIGNHAFANCESLPEITIPESVEGCL